MKLQFIKYIGKSRKLQAFLHSSQLCYTQLYWFLPNSRTIWSVMLLQSLKILQMGDTKSLGIYVSYHQYQNYFHCAKLRRPALHYSAFSTALHWTAIYCIVLHYTALHCTALYHTALSISVSAYISLFKINAFLYKCLYYVFMSFLIKKFQMLW